ncbi:Surfeit locus protein 1 [Citrus sinensis]|uniref:surfeit locus protein 1-like isoform X3 n=1 Tax=Citrus sinensis TaxID=2711 RepID=UPI00219A3EF6|nr:surfeit locus protein 1-like isoform X3 [Citrus sinensis]KAH9741878.1 Surfeit locus protein 1 [Citrus sinensis]
MKVKEKMAVASISKTLTKLGGGSSFLLSHRAPPRLYSSSAAAALSSAPQLSSSSQDQENVRKGSAPSSTWSKWLLFLPGAISFGLGTWQIFRRQDKIKMLEYRQNRLQMDPLRLNITSPLTEDLKSLEFRRVICQGVFDEQRSIYVGPRSRSISGVTENGYYVITPLMPIPNNPQSVKSPVLVNRGWVPRSWRDKSSEVSRDSEQPLNLAPSVQQSQQSSWWWFWLKKPNIVEKLLVLFVGVRSQAFLYQQMIQAPVNGSMWMFLQLLVLVGSLKTLSILRTPMKMSILATLTLFQKMSVLCFGVQSCLKTI